ncbi:hypothetical protein V8E54_015160 [Elaphomyces granulatus]
MASKSTHHCSFSATVELTDLARVVVVRGSSISIPATLQGPPWSTVPDLKIISDIPLEIEFYNEAGEELTKGSVAICFGTISFQDRSPSLPRLSVKASRLSSHAFVHIEIAQTISTRIRGRYAKAALLNMLKAMMAFKPGDWTTATKQIIESEWMEKWALPELSRLKEAEGA